MKGLAKNTACAVSIALVALFTLSGVVYAAGGQVRGAYSSGNAGLYEDPVDPPCIRYGEDPADGDKDGFKDPVPEVVPAQEQIRVVGPGSTHRPQRLHMR